MKTKVDQSVRQKIATFTQRDHECLHTHAWISRLASPDITVAHYQLVLSAYQGFFARCELQRQQLDMFRELSLAPAIQRLESDTSKSIDLSATRPPVQIGAVTVPDVLAALYVLHGAGFGARTLNANIRKSLPQAPRHYLSSGTSSETWRQLVSHLDACRGDTAMVTKLCDAAGNTFRRFGAHVSRVCDRAGAGSGATEGTRAREVL